MSVDVSQKTEQIRSAIYGKNVRENIAGGIEDIANAENSLETRQTTVENLTQEAINLGGNPSLEVTQARGSHANLNERLDANDSLISTKANQTDLDTTNTTVANNYSTLDTKINSQASGSPKDVFTYLDDLQNDTNANTEEGKKSIYLVTGNVKEVDTLTISSSPTVSGNVTVTLNGVATDIPVTTGVVEVANLTITAVPTMAGNITIILDGVAHNIAVDPATDTTIDAIATKIRNTAFSGWATGGTGSTVTFTANVVGAKTDSTFADTGSTGVTGTITTTTQGVDADTVNTVATKIRNTMFAEWATGGDGATVVFTKSEVGVCSTPSFTDTGGTGVTGTIVVTAKGADADGKWYYWDGSGWVPGGTYQSTGIVDGSITATKTSFLAVKNSNNLINNSSIYLYKGLNYELAIPVYLIPNTTYVLTNVGNSRSDIQILILDKLKNTLQTILAYNNFNGSAGLVFTTGDNINGNVIVLFRTIDTDISSWIGTFSLSQNIDLDFEDGEEYDVHSKLKISLENTNFIKKYNLKPNKWRNGFILSSVGTIAPNNSYKTSYGKIAEPNTNYYCNKNLYFLCEYNANGTFIRYQTSQSNLVASDYSFFKTSENTKYVKFSININIDTSDFVFCPTIDNRRYTFIDAEKPMLLPSLYDGGIKMLSDYQDKKLVTDGDSIVAQGKWQYYVIKNMGMILYANTAIGGSKVTEMCLDSRINAIPIDTDILILNGGTNDASQGVALGTIDSPHDATTFYGAYQLRLDKIYARCPNAKVFIMNMPYKVDENTVNSAGLKLSDYQIAIMNISNKYGYPLIDIRNNMGVNALNYASYMADGTHPDISTGAKNMAECIIGKLRSIANLQYYNI